MLVQPRPGTDRRVLRESMRKVHIDLQNVRGRGATALDYLDWANLATRQLGSLVSSKDLARLIHTRRYELLLAATDGHAGALPHHTGLLNLELDEQIRVFEEAVAELEEQIGRWTSLALFISPDTSFYIHHPAKLRDINFQQVLHDAGLYPSLRGANGEIHILVPAAVVDELDRLKESKDRHVRWRAAHTLGTIDELFMDPGAQPLLYQVEQDPWRNATVTMELMFDPIGHARLPESDDEIINRLIGAKPLAAREITLITYDTGMSTRARRVGLRVVKPPRDFGPEPS